MTSRQNGSVLLRSVLLALLAVALAAWLMFESFQRHLSRACVIRDTVYLGLCPDPEVQLPAARLEALRRRIESAPGDSRAYIELAILARSPDAPAGLNAAEALRIAVSLAPHDKDLLRMQARSAAEAKAWKKMAALLVELAQFHQDYGAAAALARLVTLGPGADLLMDYVQADSRWLLMMMETIPRDGLPMAQAVPLLIAGYGRGIVPPDVMASAIKNLKGTGNWEDAYALWIRLQPQSVGLLYNPGFDRPLRADGFDWETYLPDSRRGAIAQRTRFPDRGYVLSVQYSGRGVEASPVRQTLFLYPGKYRLEAQYMTDKLRSEQGLAWVIRCTSTQDLLGRSPAIGDTGRAWRNLLFEFEVPDHCLPVVNLQLETFAPYEAAAGFTGKAYFDNMSLQRLTGK